VLNYGVFNLNSETLLFSKIQDIQVNRSVLERMCSISTVVVQNAMGKPEIIPGLGTDTAEILRELILSHIAR
jgi:membrane protein YdbS with pleckstrin-like domain